MWKVPRSLSIICLFVLILYVPVNIFSVMSGRVFLDWISTKQRYNNLINVHCSQKTQSCSYDKQGWQWRTRLWRLFEFKLLVNAGHILSNASYIFALNITHFKDLCVYVFGCVCVCGGGVCVLSNMKMRFDRTVCQSVILTNVLFV